MENAAPLTTYRSFLQKKFGAKTYKLTVNGGFTCPTRDGRISGGGCAFCDLRGSSSYFGKQGRSQTITDQINSRVPRLRARFKSEKFLAYFQSYTNTYDSVERLRSLYTEALSHPEIGGLCIGTRPDCLQPDVLELLDQLSKNHYISLELGVQSFHNPTLQWLERGHDRDTSIAALAAINSLAPDVSVCVHLMFGSPTEEGTSTAKEAAKILNSWKVDGVKLHQVMILKGTKLAERFLRNEFAEVSRDKYLTLINAFLSHLRRGIYIERLYATATHPEECLGPAWSTQRWATHNYFLQATKDGRLSQGTVAASDSKMPQNLGIDRGICANELVNEVF